MGFRDASKDVILRSHTWRCVGEDVLEKLSSSMIGLRIGIAFVTFSSLDFWLTVLVALPDLYKFPDLKYIQEHNTYLRKCLQSFELSTHQVRVNQDEWGD